MTILSLFSQFYRTLHLLNFRNCCHLFTVQFIFLIFKIFAVLLPIKFVKPGFESSSAKPWASRAARKELNWLGKKKVSLYWLWGCFKLSGHRFIEWQFQCIGNVLGWRKIRKKQELWGLSWLQENLSDWRVSRMEAVAGCITCDQNHHLTQDPSCITWSRSPIRSDLDSGSYLSKYATMHHQHIVKKSNNLKPSPKCAQRPQTHGGQLRSPEMIVLGYC